MDTRLRRASSLVKAYPSKNRQETATAATRRHRDLVAVVTAGRSDSVVQPSMGQFAVPLRVAAVWAASPPDPQANGLNGLLTPWRAVADYVNHRNQRFECGGAFGVWRVC